MTTRGRSVWLGVAALAAVWGIFATCLGDYGDVQQPAR